MKLAFSDVESTVYGGVFYGGGGGGMFDAALELGRAALELGSVELVDVDAIAPDATVLCTSFVGAPSDARYLVSAKDIMRSVDLFFKSFDSRCQAFMSNENGAMATVNGWVQAAYTGLPLLDAPANGRAQPTGVMGAMGLNRMEDYVAHQCAVGGSGGNYCEGTFTGSVDNTSAAVRYFASLTGGLTAVLRNPVSAAYVKENGAPGAITKAMTVGRANIAALNSAPLSAAERIAAVAGGRVEAKGTVTSRRIRTEGGFDYGRLVIDCGGVCYTSAFWNEYLDLRCGGCALAAFPDLVTLFDLNRMRCTTSAELREGDAVAIIVVPAGKLCLGKGMFIPENMTVVNRLIREHEEED